MKKFAVVVIAFLFVESVVIPAVSALAEHAVKREEAKHTN